MNDVKSLSLRDVARLLSDAVAAGSDGAIAALAVENEVRARTGGADVQHYVLNGREPIPATPEEYIEWRKSAGWPCRIAATEVDVSLVSTEFTGADLRIENVGRPVLFQTVIYSDDQDFDSLSWGAESYAEAEQTHRRVVAALEGGHDAMVELLDECAA